MKKKEWLVIFLLIAFGLIYQIVEKGKIRFSKDFSYYSDEKRLIGSQFAEFFEKEKIFQKVNEIVIENPAGEININRSKDGQVRFLAFFRIYYSNKSDVDKIYKKTSIKTEFHENELKISSRYLSGFQIGRASCRERV